MTIYFISDLHLSADAKDLLAIFKRFIIGPAKQAEQLYILGDLFEAWIGDDNDEAFVQEISKTLLELSKTTALFMMPGNRDFLIGEKFAQACGATFLQDPIVINLYGSPTLLTHGDLLCTDDKAYQRWRKIAHCKLLQRLFMLLPLSFRRAIADSLRKQSKNYTQALSPSHMDVTEMGLNQMLKRHAVTGVIHGHTHRPSIHYFTRDNRPFWHYVLSDWHQTGNALMCERGTSPQLVSLS